MLREPIKLGYLFDFVLPEGYPKEMRADLTQSFELVFAEGLEQGLIDRPVEIVFREVEGLPKGSVKAVIDAYGELVDEGCLAVFGPAITDNCVPTKEAIEERFHVPAISVTGTDDWLGEWTFSLSMGSMTDEPIFWAHLIAKGGLDDVGVLVEQSLVGETYIKSFRAPVGTRASASSPRNRSRRPPRTSARQSGTLHDAGVGAVVHCGFGFGVVLINPVLQELGWDPPRFMGTSFQNAWINPIVWNADRRMDRCRPVRRAATRSASSSSTGTPIATVGVPSTASRWSTVTSPRCCFTPSPTPGRSRPGA